MRQDWEDVSKDLSRARDRAQNDVQECFDIPARHFPDCVIAVISFSVERDFIVHAEKGFRELLIILLSDT